VPSLEWLARTVSVRRPSFRLRSHPLVILSVLSACEILGPTAALPEHAVALAAPIQYQDWWARTEACSGRQGRLADVAWFVVPDVTEFPTPDGAEVGRWTRGSNGTRIVIAEAYLDDELVVRHEMLHALMDRGDHPAAYFADRCHLTWATWRG
jgi:hypothetical protein